MGYTACLLRPDVLALQSQSIERQLDALGYPGVYLPSYFAMASNS